MRYAGLNKSFLRVIKTKLFLAVLGDSTVRLAVLGDSTVRLAVLGDGRAKSGAYRTEPAGR